MKKILWILIVFVGLFIIIGVLSGGDKKVVPKDKPEVNQIINTGSKKITGSMYTPANFPQSSSEQIQEYFTLAEEMGNHISLLIQWSEYNGTLFARQLQNGAKQKGLKFYVTLSPITVSGPNGSRDRVSVRPGVLGDSFGDERVRQAFKNDALELASIKPDILGIGSEANLLSVNQKEFDAFTSLMKETYDAIKAKYSTQEVMITFQYDVYQKKIGAYGEINTIKRFDQSLDLYGFTSYPFVFSSDIPENYYQAMKEIAVGKKVGLAELGADSDGLGEAGQAKFYARLPVLLQNVNPEFITFFKMHDFSSGSQDKFNSIGVKKSNGEPKLSWEVVKKLRF